MPVQEKSVDGEKAWKPDQAEGVRDSRRLLDSTGNIPSFEEATQLEPEVEVQRRQSGCSNRDHVSEFLPRTTPKNPSAHSNVRATFFSDPSALLTKQFFTDIKNNNVLKVTIAINRGFGVNTRNDEGLPALHAAVFGANSSIVALLLNKNVDVNLLYNGSTALHQAVVNNLSDIARLLVENGADIHIQGANGVTPMGLAQLIENEEIRLLFNNNNFT